MKTNLLQRVLITLAVAAALAAPPARADEETEVYNLKQQFFPGQARWFETDFTIGDLLIEGVDQRNVEVELRFFCQRDNLEKCRKAAQKVYLVGRSHGDRFDLELERTPRARIQGIRAVMKVRLPRQLAVEVDARTGSVVITGVPNDIEIDAGNADVEIVQERNLVGEVTIAIGVGHARLWVDGGEIKASGFPRSIRWSGQGNRRIEVDCGSGNVDVKLR